MDSLAREIREGRNPARNDGSSARAAPGRGSFVASYDVAPDEPVAGPSGTASGNMGESQRSPQPVNLNDEQRTLGPAWSGMREHGRGDAGAQASTNQIFTSHVHPSGGRLTRAELRRSSLTQALRLYPMPPSNLAPQPMMAYGMEQGSSTVRSRSSPESGSPADRMLDAPQAAEPINPQVSSAPPSPAATAVLHPPAYIHTHHPRRGSLTPLNLNAISPVAPSPHVQEQIRRKSAQHGIQDTGHWPVSASTTAIPMHFSPARRKSLTPSLSTLAAPSPTRLTAPGTLIRTSSNRPLPVEEAGEKGSSGSRLRPSVSEGHHGDSPPPPFGSRSGASATLAALGAGLASTSGSHGRRGSAAQPHAESSAMAQSQGIPPPIDVSTDFKFGEAGAAGATTPTTAQGAMGPSSATPASVSSSEAAEAERQRIAFMTSTYGKVPRASIGGPGDRRMSAIRTESGLNMPGSLGNEGYRRGSLALSGYQASTPGESSSVPERVGRTVGHTDDRRGSLPIAIPLPRGQSKRHDLVYDYDRNASAGESPPFEPPSIDDSPELQPVEAIRDSSPPARRHLQRPLPPLMPLSDPGPRMLPSAIALQRANHLLQYKQLEAEPLPHPLPSSLHPPQPVDVSDFDLDFILSGSHDAPPDHSSPEPSRMPTPALLRRTSSRNVKNKTLKLGIGAEDEDSFAKFVGEFDDEYDGRRGDWTFRAFPNPAGRKGADATSVWAARGAGAFKILAKGVVECERSGQRIAIARSDVREYEITVDRPDATSPTKRQRRSRQTTCVVLAPKRVHNELGGVKSLIHRRIGAKQRPSDPATITTAGSKGDRRLANSLPTDTLLARQGDGTSPRSLAERRRSGSHRAVDPERPERTFGSFAKAGKANKIVSQADPAALSGRDRERRREKSSLGSKIKRSWLGSLTKSSAQPLDDKREEQQQRSHSQSWSGGSSASSGWSSTSQEPPTAIANDGISKTAMKPSQEAPYQPPWLLFADGVNPNSTKPAANRADSSSRDSEQGNRTSREASIEEGISALGWKEGKAWEAVPPEALAMVLPLSAAALRSASISAESTAGPAEDATPAIRASSEFSSAFFDNPPARSLLVWYMPFVSKDAEAKTPTHRKFSTGTLLRRTSRDKLKESVHAGSPSDAGEALNSVIRTLPFRSCRIVACVVRPEDLRSEPQLPAWPSDDVDSPALSKEVSPVDVQDSSFPTVIGVCHSRNQGIEFVMEGLDRLGLCKQTKESPWGPMGYEEWRGGGLTDEARLLMDVLWAGCAAVLGLAAAAQAPRK